MQVVKLSALRTGRLYSQEIFLVLISVRVSVFPLGHSAAGRIMSIKNPVTPLAVKPTISRLVTHCLNQLRHRVPPSRALDILQTIALLEYPFSLSVCRRRIFFRNYWTNFGQRFFWNALWNPAQCRPWLHKAENRFHSFSKHIFFNDFHST
jgi:hypothetical protein